MYSLPHFSGNDRAAMLAFMETHPFAFLCGADGNGKPVATQVPLLVAEREEKLFLRGHMMRNTDHHHAFEQHPQALAVFTGPHTYVSASWYGNPQQASTWNYMSVHASGPLRFLSGEELWTMLRDTTSRFEGESSAASFDALPADYVHRLSKGIIAFEMEVQQLNSVFKLSQNRNEADFINIIRQLRNGDENARAVAAEMEKIQPQLFSSSSKLAKP